MEIPVSHPVGYRQVDLEPIEQEEEDRKMATHGRRHSGIGFPFASIARNRCSNSQRHRLHCSRIIDDAPVGRLPCLVNEKWKMEESYGFFRCAPEDQGNRRRGSVRSHVCGESLDDVERKLAISLNRSGHTEILKSFQERSRQYRAVESMGRKLDWNRRAVEGSCR